MSGKIPALPVYPFWLRVNPSRHEALFSSTGVYQKDLPHVEVSLVQGLVPMFQKFTSSVFSDYTKFALDGHDVGPMVPHVYWTGPPDNGLLPMTILSSSCKFPVTAQARLHKGKRLCAYFPAIAPYLYCNSAKESEEPPAPTPTPTPGGSKLQSLKSDIGKKFKGLGVGIVLIPTGPFTVVLRLGLKDLALGVYSVLERMAIGMVFDKGWGLMIRGQPAGKWYASRFSSGAAWRYTRDKLLSKTAKDMATGFVRNCEIGLPYQLAKMDYKTGKVKVWTYESEGWTSSSAAPVPLELLPEDPNTEPTPEPSAASPDKSPGYWADPTESGKPTPQQAFLDELLTGAPHAF